MRCRRAFLAFLLCLAVAAPAAAEIRGASVASASSGGGSGSPKNAEVLCPAGMNAIGGGPMISGTVTGVAPIASEPVLEVGTGEPIGWFVESTEVVASASSWSLIARAVCGRVAGLELVQATSPSSSEFKSIEVACPAGKFALSGGFELLGSTQGVVPYGSTPVLDPITDAPIGWDVGAHEEIDTSASWSIRASVLCSDEPTVAVRAYPSPGSDQHRHLDLFCPSGWITTGGGATVSGVIKDWLTLSNPSSTLRSWTSWFQRQVGVTGDASLDFHAVCPEPGASTSSMLALAAVAACAKRRPRRV